MNSQRNVSGVAADIARRLGERLRSVVLYGSAARGEFLESRSDINLLVLLDRIDAPVLRRLSPSAADWARLRVNPMLLEEREWQRASDAFAVELLDMLDAREVLHGEDPVADVVIRHADARLQAERELRARIIALHNGMVRCSEPEDLGQLLIAALPSFATYLRTALRLAGRTVPATAREVLEDGCQLVGAPEAGWLATLDARMRDEPWPVHLDSDVISDYNSAAVQTASYLDTFGGTDS